MITRKFYSIPLGVFILCACAEKSPVLIFGNSSKSNELNVEFSVNGKVTDTIIIPPFANQDYQWNNLK